METRLQGEELPVTNGMITRRRRSVGRRLPVVAVCGLVAIALVAAASPARDRAAAPAGHGAHLSSVAAGHSGHVTSGAIGRATPAEAALQLQALIGQHSVLVADMMRGRLRGDSDFAQAANAALGKNTDAMSELVGSLFGSAAKAQFATVWSAHVTAFFEYARALGDQDSSALDRARTGITAHESELAKFFVGASQGRLSQAAAETAVRAHVDHLVQQADAYAAKDYTRSAQLYRQSYAHSFALGTALATALLGPRLSAALTTPQWRLQSELGRLLGEHVALVVAAIRPGTANAPDFPAAAEALNGNTRDLAGAVDSLFGAAVAKRFQSLWADHIDQIIVYAGAVMSNDTASRDQARAKLDAFERQLASYLSASTGKRLGTPVLTQALTLHDEMLLRVVDAFAAKEYQQAHDLAYSTYQHMIELAGQLSAAIGATIASRLPKGGAQTGGGGMAAVVGRR